MKKRTRLNIRYTKPSCTDLTLTRTTQENYNQAAKHVMSAEFPNGSNYKAAKNPYGIDVTGDSAETGGDLSLTGDDLLVDLVDLGGHVVLLLPQLVQLLGLFQKGGDVPYGRGRAAASDRRRHLPALWIVCMRAAAGEGNWEVKGGVRFRFCEVRAPRVNAVSSIAYSFVSRDPPESSFSNSTGARATDGPSGPRSYIS